jgi:hypothetical protein
MVEQFLEFRFRPGRGIDFTPDINVYLILVVLTLLEGVVVSDFPFGMCERGIVVVWDSLEVLPGEFLDFELLLDIFLGLHLDGLRVVVGILLKVVVLLFVLACQWIGQLLLKNLVEVHKQ